MCENCPTLSYFVTLFPTLSHFTDGKFAFERAVEDGLAEAGGALKIGRHDGFQFVQHAQPPLHFRYDPRLLSRRRNWNRKAFKLRHADGCEISRMFALVEKELLTKREK